MNEELHFCFCIVFFLPVRTFVDSSGVIEVKSNLYIKLINSLAPISGIADCCFKINK